MAPHLGLDFAAPEGTPIRATHAGEVDERRAGGYGNLVTVTAPDGSTRYAHLKDNHGSEAANLMWPTVYRGSVIGQVGSTGRSTGPHLHYEVRGKDGKPIDPRKANVNLWGNRNPVPAVTPAIPPMMAGTQLQGMNWKAGSPIYSLMGSVGAGMLGAPRHASMGESFGQGAAQGMNFMQRLPQMQMQQALARMQLAKFGQDMNARKALAGSKIQLTSPMAQTLWNAGRYQDAMRAEQQHRAQTGVDRRHSASMALTRRGQDVSAANAANRIRYQQGKEERANKRRLITIGPDGKPVVNPVTMKAQTDIAKARGEASRSLNELESSMRELKRLEEVKKTRALTPAEQRRYDTYSRIVGNKALLDPGTRKRLENLGLASTLTVDLAKKVASADFHPTRKLVGHSTNRAVSQMFEGLKLALATGFDRGANFTDTEQAMIGALQGGDPNDITAYFTQGGKQAYLKRLRTLHGIIGKVKRHLLSARTQGNVTLTPWPKNLGGRPTRAVRPAPSSGGKVLRYDKNGNPIK